MPRQKSCSVAGCPTTTDDVRRQQGEFRLAARRCPRCPSKGAAAQQCRCPPPDMHTVRKEARTKFASWCAAIGLADPGYYVNVCHRHFSEGAPSR